MQAHRILTFNWHDPYLYMFSKVGGEIAVGDWMRRADGTCGWDLRKRPVPENVLLLRRPEEAAERLESGEVDLAVCHTLQDLRFLQPFAVPTIYLAHNALHTDAANDRGRMARVREEVEGALDRRGGVFAAISPMKLTSWGMEGFVVLPGMDLED